MDRFEPVPVPRGDGPQERPACEQWEWFCEHPNENPNVCPCAATCGCRQRHCKHKPVVLGCEDCGLPYRSFPIDVVLPDDDWLRIHPSGRNGVLCAQCITKRAAALPKAIVLYARIVPDEHHDQFRAIKNLSWAEITPPLSDATQEPPTGSRTGGLGDPRNDMPSSTHSSDAATVNRSEPR